MVFQCWCLQLVAIALHKYKVKKRAADWVHQNADEGDDGVADPRLIAVDLQ